MIKRSVDRGNFAAAEGRIDPKSWTPKNKVRFLLLVIRWANQVAQHTIQPIMVTAMRESHSFEMRLSIGHRK